jgi:signal transduction histidine kinase
MRFDALSAGFGFAFRSNNPSIRTKPHPFAQNIRDNCASDFDEVAMRRFWLLYAAGWVPLVLFYAVATQGNAFLRGELQVFPALFGALWGLGPAPVLLTLVWPLTGFIERRRLPALPSVAIHTMAAVLFVLTWLLLSFTIAYFAFTPDEARRAALNFFVWQGMWGLMMYAVVAGVFHAVRAVEAARTQALATAQAETLLTRSELVALRNKLNPHFLFNTLHSIIALTRKDAKAAEAALLKFSDMLRYVLETEKSGVDMVRLEDELQFVRDYLDLESLRLGNRLSVDWQIDDNAKSHLVPALSVQPLVENSIKHAFNPRIQQGVLTISAKLDSTNKKLVIVVNDDGPGCDLATVSQSTGLGVRTVERRLKLEYRERATFNISTAPKLGFSAQMAIPVAEN